MNTLDVVQRLRLSSCLRLGLTLLWIGIFVGIAAADRTCGTDFVDVGSSTLLAPVVVEGRAKRVRYETGEQGGAVQQSSSGVSVVFDRLRLYKGQLADWARSIEVGYFSLRADAESCVAPLPNIRRSYVLFVRQGDNQTGTTNSSSVDNDARRLHRYQLTAFPIPKSRRSIATVREFTNCTRCGMWISGWSVLASWSAGTSLSKLYC